MPTEPSETDPEPDETNPEAEVVDSGTPSDANGSGPPAADGSRTPPTADPSGTPDAGGYSGSGIGRYLTAWTGGAAGAVVTTAFAVADAFWPALAVLAGAVVASGTLLARRGGHKRYVLSGVVYALGLALALEFAGFAVPAEYTDAVLPAAGGLGAISGVLVVAKVAGKRVVKRLAAVYAADEEYLAQVWETLASLGSLLTLVWLLVTFSEKVVRYGAVSVGAVALLVANMLGFEVLITVLGFRVEAVMALFVGCVLVWFHLLDTLHNSWRTAVQSAEKAGDLSGRGDEEAATRAEG